jgi:siroheme synthase-like protein
MQEKETNNLFPVFLKLEQMSVLIVGGGKIAQEKIEAILSNAPATKIKLVATSITEEIRDRTGSFPNVKLLERVFLPHVVKDVDLVIVAINDMAASRRIHGFARQWNKLVNVADKPELCDFYMSSIVQKGNLKIAISTNGKSPTIAKRLKETFSELLPNELDEVLQHMHLIRTRLKGNFVEKVRLLNQLTAELSIKMDDPAKG